MIKALNHISFARDWLDRAEEKISIGSLVDGEVFLSLAESEVRKAWESSYAQRKSEKKKERKQTSFKKNRLSLVIGSMILILVLFAAGTDFLYSPEESVEQFKLNLTEGYRNREDLDLYSGGNEIRLINVDFMLEKNSDRGH